MTGVVRVSRTAALTSAPTDCQHCGTHVSRDWRRTFGDEENRAHRCPRCDSMRRIQLGSAAGKHVAVPDPEKNPERTASGQFGWSV